MEMSIIANLCITISVACNIFFAVQTYSIPSPIPDIPEIYETDLSYTQWGELQVWRQLTRYWASKNCKGGLEW
jgi:hypothetical protein